MATIEDDGVCESLPLPPMHTDLLTQAGVSQLLNSLGTDQDSACKHGLCFSDGQRKVDYILAYTYKKSSGSKTPSRRTHHNDSLHNTRSAKEDHQLPGTAGDLEAAETEPKLDYHEDDKRFRREEYEGNLIETGLELEKDEETKVHGVGFVKIHAPWNVLCREAEFMKLKMPTKKVYHIKEAQGLMHKLNSVIQKITQPIQPNVAGHLPQPVKHLSYPFSREKQHMFDMSNRDSFFDSKTRSSIVYEILKRTTCTKAKYSMGITSLLANGVYSAAYPQHDGDYEGDAEPNDRKLLCHEWASYGVFYKYQPIDLVRKYFGEKIALYFAWLGVYTQMLIPASVVGIIVFLYGCATVDENIPSMEMCDQRYNITMCPLCDRTCNYWKMSSACATARASHLFDNPATVFFSVFMALWAATFMEHWKRRQMRLNYRWDLTNFEEEECAPGGCLMELCIQLSIIMLGKQLIQNNLFEIGIPKMKKLIRYIKSKRQSYMGHEEHLKRKQRYEMDYNLEPFAGLTPEYMEMIIQFGFVTLFVASFPLAPLFALLNNIIEIRLDAKKFITELRRPVAVRAKDIGIWYNILQAVGKLAVIINVSYCLCHSTLSMQRITPGSHCHTEHCLVIPIPSDVIHNLTMTGR
ncbi:hypothetical protein FKM82_003417 [Ascaphus truei]